MNPIEPISKLPDLPWREHSRKEMLMINAVELVDSSDFVYRIGNIAAIGYIYNSLVNPPWMWFVLAENISIGDLVDLRRACELIPKGTLTCVMDGYVAGFKFAKLYGFEMTDEELDNCGKKYRVMRKR
jgi:hypothetical protein